MMHITVFSVAMMILMLVLVWSLVEIYLDHRKQRNFES